MDNRKERQEKNIFGEQREGCKYSRHSNLQPSWAGLLGVKLSSVLPGFSNISEQLFAFMYLYIIVKEIYTIKY